jgi:hypothetical protein
MSEDNENYEVGKGKPPKKHQFKPGQSGNPKGRPKGSKNVHHVLTKILGEKITITDAGKKMVVDKLEGAIRVMVNKSFEGSPASLKLLLEVLEYGGESEQPSAENPFTDEDHAALMKELDWLDEVRVAYGEETSNDTK